MKKILGIISLGLTFAGCGKVEEYSNNFASANFLNVVPFDPPAPGIAATTMRVFEDTINRSATGLSYRASSGYLAFSPGTKNIQLRSSADLNTVFAEAGNQVFEYNKASTYLIYDTVNNSTGKAKLARLRDTLSSAGNGFIKVRFLHLAKLAPDLDVTLLRTSATPRDSVTFFGTTYLGENPTDAELQALSTFTTMPLGTYTLRLKQAGTQTLIAPPANFTIANLAGTGGITGISSIYITGTAKQQPLSVGLLRHYP